MKSFALILCSTALLAGCASQKQAAASPQPAPEPSIVKQPKAATKETTTKETVSEPELRLDLPKGWVRVTSDRSAMQDALAKAGPAKAQLEEAIKSAEQLKAQGNLVLMAMNPGKDKLSENLNVLAQALPAGFSNLEQIKPEIAANLKQSLPNAAIGKVEAIPLPMGKTLKVRSTHSLSTEAAGKVPVQVTQYLYIRNAKLYIFSFTSGAKKGQEHPEVYQQVMKSVVFT